MRATPEAVTDKEQAYPTPKNIKEVQAFEGFGGSKDFCSLPGTGSPSLYLLLSGQGWHMWAWGSEKQAILKRQIG